MGLPGVITPMLNLSFPVASFCWTHSWGPILQAWPSLPKDVSKVPDDTMAILKSGPRAEVQICQGGRGMGSPKKMVVKSEK